MKITTAWKELDSSWNNFLPVGHNLELQQLSVVEEVSVYNVAPRYLQVYDGDKLQMQFYAQVLTFSNQFLSAQEMPTMLRSFCLGGLNCMRLKLLVVGHLFRHDGEYTYIAPDVKDKLQLYTTAIALLEKEIKHQAIFLKDLPQAYSLPFKVNPRYSAFDNDVSMQMQLPAAWQSFSDYENALTKKYAKRLRSTQKNFEAVEVRELSIEDVQLYSQQIFELYLQVAKHQSVTFGLLNEAYFPVLKKRLGKKLLMYGFFYQNELIAFSSAILHDAEYDMNYIGFDYARNAQLSLYFNMLFFFVKDAIDKKNKVLVLGRTALEAKAILGCKPVPIKGYYKIKNRFFASITAAITKRTAREQGDMWMHRHPFKTESGT